MTTPLQIRAVAAAACILAVVLGGVADARARKPSGKRNKQKQDQMAYMQLEMARYQSDVAAIQQEIFTSFDADGDGKLTGREKSGFDRRMNDIQRGKVQNPFALIIPPGQGPRPKSPVLELEKRAAEYRTGMLAKQQEVLASFDENGDGELEGPERSKFDRYMRDIQAGKVPNPFATVGSGAGPATDAPARK